MPGGTVTSTGFWGVREDDEFRQLGAWMGGRYSCYWYFIDNRGDVVETTSEERMVELHDTSNNYYWNIFASAHDGLERQYDEYWGDLFDAQYEWN